MTTSKISITFTVKVSPHKINPCCIYRFTMLSFNLHTIDGFSKCSQIFLDDLTKPLGFLKKEPVNAIYFFDVVLKTEVNLH